MLNLIAAALVAAAPAAPAAPATPAPPADAHAQHQQGQQPVQMKPGMMAEMKDCCCKDMMAKMHEGHAKQHDAHPSR